MAKWTPKFQHITKPDDVERWLTLAITQGHVTPHKTKGFLGRPDYGPVKAVTLCHLHIPTSFGSVVCTGHAICGPKDQFSRKRGRQISLNRATKLANRADVYRRFPRA